MGCRQYSPHKPGPIPLLDIPGLRTDNICTDPMHTFHLGWGADMAASCVVVLSRLGFWGTGALDSKLSRAYNDFMMYCTAHGRTTSCENFSKKDFDMWLVPK